MDRSQCQHRVQGFGAGPGILQGAWNWVPSQPTRDTFDTRWGEERRPNQIHDAVSYVTVTGSATTHLRRVPRPALFD
jgi:hypothetical protein